MGIYFSEAVQLGGEWVQAGGGWGGAVQNIAIFSQHEISSYEPIVKCIHIIH